MLRVLLVDGHDDYRDMLVELLREHGFEATPVATPDQALAIAAALRPELTLLELYGIKNPAATLQAVRAVLPAGGLLVGITTWIPVPPDVARMVDAVLAKPFQIERVVELLRTRPSRAR